MGEIRIRDVDNEVVQAWKLRAERRGHTLTQEIRELLTREAERPRRDLVADLERMHARTRAEFGELPDSTTLIREQRDKRG